MPRQYRTPKAFASSRPEAPIGGPSKNRADRDKHRTALDALNVFEIDVDEDEKTKDLINHGAAADSDDEDGQADYNMGNISIDREDDEEIDEDMAFDEEDEERWGDYFAQRRNREKATSRYDRDSNGSSEGGEENEDDDDFENDSDAMDMSDLLAGETSASVVGGSKGKKKLSTAALQDLLLTSRLGGSGDAGDAGGEKESGSDYDEEYKSVDEYEESLIGGETEEEDDEDERIDSLRGFVESLDSDPRNQSAADLLNSGEEEYSEDAQEASIAGGQLTLQSMLGLLSDQSGYASLKRQVRSLERSSEPVAAPLAPRIQQRVDRQVAYRETAETISKWMPVVKSNRQAEHLSFPLNEPPVQQLSVNNLTASHKSSTLLEQQIDGILQKAGLRTEKDIVEAENLAMNHLDPEEVKRQRAELQRMRSVLFYAEMKEKRAAKIKSKKYRRILKKEKERMAAKNVTVSAEDDGYQQNESAEMEARLEAEKLRAEERMTLKHKNTSKWARNALRFGEHNDQTRAAVFEQLQRHEELVRKQQGLGSDSDEADSSSDDMASDNNGGDNLQELIDDLSARNEDENLSSSATGKGLFSMKFMQNAMKKRRQEAIDRIADMKNDLETERALRKELDEAADNNDTDYLQVSSSKKPIVSTASITNVSGNPGRQVFGGPESTTKKNKKRKVRSATIENDAEHGEYYQRPSDEELSGNEDDKFDVVAGQKTSQNRSANKQPEKLQSSKRNSGKSGSANDSSDNKNPWIISDENPWLKTDDNGDDFAAAKQDASPATASIVYEVAAKIPPSATVSKRTYLSTKVGAVPVPSSVTRQVKQVVLESDTTAITVDINMKQSPNAGQIEETDETTLLAGQRDLIRLAFANDDLVEEEFEKEKAEMVEEDAPKTIDATLPGWGSWEGAGIDPAKQRKRRKPQHLVPPKIGSGVAPTERKDRNLQFVVINEKRDKKFAGKYLADKVPFPYQTREQYEAMIRNPLGREWNTTATHQSLNKPRVKTRSGKVIDPPTMAIVE